MGANAKNEHGSNMNKNKRDIHNRLNYRRLKLWERVIELIGHTMKLRERVIEKRLNKDIQVNENQFVFI